MSSYFDRMAHCAADPWAVAELVRSQYRWYLHKLNDECFQKDLERLNNLIAEFERIKPDRSMGPEWAVQEYHTFAHRLAEARIRLRGGRRAMDNPPIPLGYSTSRE